MSVQSKRSGWVSGGLAVTLTLSSTPDSASTLIAILTMEGNSTSTIDTAGWTELERLATSNGNGLALYSAAGTAGDTIHVPNGPGAWNRHLAVYEVADAIEVHGKVTNGNFASSGIGTISGPTLTQAESDGTLIAGFTGSNQTYVAAATFTAVSPLVALGAAQRTGRVHAWSGEGPTTAGSWTPQVSVTGLTDQKPTAVVAVILSHTPPAAPTADFTGTPLTGTEPLTVAFTDLSGLSPTSWLWDFGDGDTSTSQNPTHVYSAAGTYTVSLTATNANGSDTETKVAYINVTADVGYEAPPPGRAILEIKATPPGADRWDEALWDEGRWSSTSWQDVTPYGVEVAILWGSNRPEFGILSTPDAASWAISFYDPDRILDPANPDSPYSHDLQPYLPVRLRHNETVIKQGFLESGSHKFSDGTGYWRVMDIQASLANAVVPEDTTLSDTLFQRARDAIAAAGLSITVAPDPPGGDPALAPWATQGRTAWEWIADAAQQVLWVPYVRNDNTLGFRDYRNPMARGRSIGSPNLEDLQSLTMHNGLFSIVGALELVSEGTDINRRELTPKPRYGAREYLRNDPTPNSGDWAQAVLDDRAVASLRWTPGKVYPFTAAEAHYFATIEALEQVSVNYPEQDILFDGIVVGGTIHVIGKKDADALWDFQYFLAQIPLQPLTDDDDVSSYLTNDDDATDILYPDV